jgi:type II secretory pathway component PulJ
MNRKAALHFRRSQPRGVALLVALAALAIAGVVFASMLQTAALSSRRLRARERHLQADLLIESGLRRAVALLAADADFRQDEWRIDGEESPLAMPARITLRAEPSDERPGYYAIEVSAVYGEAEGRRVERSRSIEVKRAMPGETP